VPTYGERRRVPGLRREELALLAGAAGQVQLWEAGHTIDRALFAGDLLHTPLQVAHPDHSSCFCQDPAQARTTRRRLLGWAADANALVLPAHFSGHSALEVEHRGDGFAIRRWAPITRY
jgi:glyoxylase-like metal-dependent hydrolase (beta-lactamase superfamily II)